MAPRTGASARAAMCIAPLRLAALALSAWGTIAAVTPHRDAHSRSPRGSLLGGPHTWDDVLAARAHAAAAAPPASRATLPPASRATLRATLVSAHVSGIAEVRLEWSAGAAAGDVIALYCGAAADDADFADFLNAGAAGVATVRLPRGVAGCAAPIFRYLRGGAHFIGRGDGSTTDTVVRAAETAPLSLGDTTDPVGTRLAFGDSPSDMLLTWTSLDGTAPAVASVGTARGGPYALNFTATGPPRTYKASDLCHAPANETGPASFLDPGFFHTVRLSGLAPGARYFVVYGQVGGAEAPETTFRTRAAPGPDVPVRFAAFGDAATYPVFPGTVTTVDLILALDALDPERPVDFVAMIGDLAYAEGAVLVWALWTGFMWPIASRLPFMVTVGNHETNVGPGECPTNNSITRMSEWQGTTAAADPYGDDSGGEGAFATFQRYSGPASGLGVLWYSFDVGSVHFVLWSSEHDYTQGSAQRAWLEQDLLGVNRSVTPWLVVAMHRPMYNARDDSDWTITTGMAFELESLFVAAEVDLALSGHYHLYERTHSLRNFTVDATGASPVYVTVGTGGATYHNESVRPDSLAWTAHDESEWGFGVVEAFNRSALRFSFCANADGGAVHDEVFILRPEREEGRGRERGRGV
jgi:hypothetical protein